MRKKNPKSAAIIAHEKEVLKKAWRILVIYVGIPLATLVIWALWMGSSYSGILTREGMEFAQLARNICNGDGFVTSVIRPLGLEFSSGILPMADLINAPLFPLIESVLFLIGGATDRMAAFASGIGWMLSVLFVYLLTQRITSSRKAAFLSVLLFFLNVPLLNLAITGQPYTWLTALTVALFYILSRSLPDGGQKASHPPYVICLLSAMLCGLIALTSYSLFFVLSIPVFSFWMKWARLAGFSSTRNRRSTTSRQMSLTRFLRRNHTFHLCGCFIVCLFLTLLPWLVRNSAVTGSPFFTLRAYDVMSYSGDYPGLSVFRQATPPEVTPFFYILFNVMTVFRQSILALTPLPMTFARLMNPVVLIVFVMSIFTRGGVTCNSLKRLTLWMLMLATVFFSLLSANFMNFAMFSGVITALTGSFLYTFLREYSRRTTSGNRSEKKTGIAYWFRKVTRYYRKDLILLLVLLLAALPFVSNRLRQGGAPQPPTMPPAIEYLSNLADEPVVMTTAPWAVAWHAKKTALIPPQTLEGYQTMTNELAISPEWIYFNIHTIQSMRRIEPVPEYWIEILTSPADSWAVYQPNEALRQQEMLRRRNDIEVPPARSKEKNVKQ